MLIQHGLHMTRASQIDGGYAPAVQASRLEERILFSASAIAPVTAELANAGASVASLLAEPAADSGSSGDLFPISDQQMLDLIADTILPAGAEIQSSPVEVTADEQTLELVFLDSSISNLDQMMTDLRAMNEHDSWRTLEFVVLDSSKDGIAQITSALLRYNGIDGMHIVSHGGTGQVQLGSTWLSINNLDIYRNAISAWQYSMSEQADILFYGCNLAGSEDGQRLLQEMSILTDSDVAASEDSTGGIKRNADWDLEHQIGTITLRTPMTAVPGRCVRRFWTPMPMPVQTRSVSVWDLPDKRFRLRMHYQPLQSRSHSMAGHSQAMPESRLSSLMGTV
jgi:hypothetical protein